MNRDEKRTRATALSPKIVALADHRAIFPSEPNGGTWIAANDCGICLALINWHRIEREPADEIVSRGRIIRDLADKSDNDDVGHALASLQLRHIRPFRLIAISLNQKAITEWRWNLEWLAERKHPWRREHWFSSGIDERRAEVARRRVCEHFKGGPDERLSDLRLLHRSHQPRRGPFSICMHRPDATTVSYTELAVSVDHVVMNYKAGPACSTGRVVTKRLLIGSMP